MIRPAVVVLGWAGLNALLLVVLLGYSYVDPFPLIVYMCGVLLVGSFGTAVLVAARRQAGGASIGWQRVAVKSASAAFVALAITMIGLGFLYGLWLMLMSLYPMLLAGILLRRERLSATVIPHGWRPGFDPATGHTRPRVVAADLSASAPTETAAVEAPAGMSPSPGRKATGALAAGVAGVIRLAMRRRGGRR